MSWSFLRAKHNHAGEVLVEEPQPLGLELPYRHHLGDTFFPGAGNWVFDYFQSLPIMTVAGAQQTAVNAGNAPNPFQRPQLFTPAGQTIKDIGGPIAGTYALAPLQEGDEP